MDKKILLCCILVIILMPLMFYPYSVYLTWKSYFLGCLVPLMAVIVFLVNYYKLIPDAFTGKGRFSLYVSNTILISCCFALAVAKHSVHFEEMQQQRDEQERVERRPLPPKERRNAPPRPERDEGRRYMGAFLDCINMLVAIFVAYSMRSNQRIASLQQRQSEAEMAMKEAEMAQKEAELRGLRNQISPHFLLNTLNNIYALAAISTERTQAAVMQLSKMLGHMLYDNQSEMVTLKSEAEFIQSYIDLMKLRLTSNVVINTHIRVASDSHTMVVPLLYISLVENAFKHGVSATERCFIDITLKEDADSITCDIRNSNHPKLSEDRSGHGIGLYNVQRRLDMLYPDRYEWEKGVGDDGNYRSVIVIKKA